MRQDCIKITCDNCGEEIVVMTHNGEPDVSQAKDWNLNGLSYTVIGHDFCPECTRKWKCMMRNFWGEKKYD
jgi:hypothetical protein